MQALSRVLANLYDAAEHVSMKEYPDEVLRLIRSLISFDGAVLGMGVANAREAPGLRIEQAYVFQRDQLIVPDYALVSADDPVTRWFAAGLKTPLVCNCSNFYRDNKLPALESFCKKHELFHLMLFGDSTSRCCSAKWIVLYRGANKAFRAVEVRYLMAIWPHLARALSINRRTYLDTQTGLNEQQAAALINRHGIIEVAYPSFTLLMREEWPDFDGSRIPEAILQRWRRGVDYAGSRIHIDLQPQEELIVCRASRASLINMLTHTERVVASLFARGLSHKEIAGKLQVSQHTVRSHIAHIYVKLDVHNKVALASKLGAGETALP